MRYSTMNNSSVIRVFQTLVKMFHREAILACAMIACLLMSGIVHAQDSTILNRLKQSAPQPAELVDFHFNQKEETSSGGVVEMDYRRLGEIPDVRELIQNADNVSALPDDAVFKNRDDNIFYWLQTGEDNNLSVVRFPQGKPKAFICCSLNIDWCCKTKSTTDVLD